jgi:hypothetical protein
MRLPIGWTPFGSVTRGIARSNSIRRTGHLLQPILLALLAGVWSSQVVAQASAAIFKVQGATISVPIPSGYIELRDIAGDARRVEVLRTIVGASVSPETRLLAGYFARDAINTFVRGGELKIQRAYFLATSSSPESRTLSEGDFRAAAELLRKQGKEVADTAEIARLATQGQLNAAIESMRQKIGTAGVTATIDAPIPLGVFKDEPLSIGVAALVPSTVVGGGSTKKVLDVTASLVTLIKGQLLVLKVSSGFQSKDDLDWVKDSATAWHQQMVEAN